MVKGVSEVKEETHEDHFAPDADEGDAEGGEGAAAGGEGGGEEEGDEEFECAADAPVPPGKRRLDCKSCGRSMILSPPQVLMHVQRCKQLKGGAGGVDGGLQGESAAAAAAAPPLPPLLS